MRQQNIVLNKKYDYLLQQHHVMDLYGPFYDAFMSCNFIVVNLQPR